jgi:magnesium transporter
MAPSEVLEPERNEAEAPERGALDPRFVREAVDALDRGAIASLKDKLSGLHAADLADLIGLIGPEERVMLVTSLGKDVLTPEVLSELDEDVRDEVLSHLAPQAIAEAVQALETDDAVYLLEDLDEAQKRAVLARIPESERAALELPLHYPENAAGRLMQREVVAVPPFWTVGQTIDYLRETEELPSEFFEICVVDPAFKLLGTVQTSRLVRTKRPVLIGEIMDTEPTAVPATMDQEEVAHLFERYHLVSAPVVDETKRLVGMLTVDDIVEVLQEEMSEDILALGGVREAESLTSTVVDTTRARFSWLFVNLLTAILASIVIGFFDATIEQVVALAILMPIVASMGGNAGTQTLTVSVRALATRELSPANAIRIIYREALVGSLNGIIFAALMALIAVVWFNSAPIAVIIGLAMIINLLAAGLAGILIPLGLQRFGIDPAVASAVFVTTVTDVVGFATFLGLAAWYFG